MADHDLRLASVRIGTCRRWKLAEAHRARRNKSAVTFAAGAEHPPAALTNRCDA